MNKKALSERDICTRFILVGEGVKTTLKRELLAAFNTTAGELV